MIKFPFIKNFIKNTINQKFKSIFIFNKLKFQNENTKLDEEKPKGIKFLRSPPVIGKTVGKWKPTRLTAKDLPKRNPKLEKTYPTCRAVTRDEKQSYKKINQIGKLITR
jgi:hypothetical protein